MKLSILLVTIACILILVAADEPPKKNKFKEVVRKGLNIFRGISNVFGGFKRDNNNGRPDGGSGGFKNFLGGLFKGGNGGAYGNSFGGYGGRNGGGYGGRFGGERAFGGGFIR